MVANNGAVVARQRDTASFRPWHTGRREQGVHSGTEVKGQHAISTSPSSAERNTADSPRRLLSDKSPPFNPVRPALGGPAQNHRDVPYSLNHQAALRAYGRAVELRFLCFDSFKGRTVHMLSG